MSKENNLITTSKYSVENKPATLIKKPKFIVVEGIDGSGKSTLVKSLVGIIETVDKNIIVDKLSEPGSSEIGHLVRSIVKSGKCPVRICHLLLEASRIQLLGHIKKAGVDSGTVYVVDRHKDSTYAYQGAMGVESKLIDEVQDSYKDLPQPDLTLFLEVPVVIAKARIKARARKGTGPGPDAMDNMEVEMFEKIRERYWERINKNRKKYYVVDASRSEVDVENEVRTLMEKLYK